MAPTPNKPVPTLELSIAGGGRFSLAAEKPQQFWGTTSTMPFGRPHFKEILQSLDFVIPKNYPARGDA